MRDSDNIQAQLPLRLKIFPEILGILGLECTEGHGRAFVGEDETAMQILASTFAAFLPPNNLPLSLNGHVDRTVLVATMMLSIVAATIFGILPALSTSGLAPIAVLKEEAGTMSGGPQKLRLSSALVVTQIAFSLLLLICAGLFARSLRNAQRLDPGFDSKHVLVASYELGPAGYSRAHGIEFHRQVQSRLENLPGVESMTLADFSPLSFTLHSDIVESANRWKLIAPSCVRITFGPCGLL